MKRFIKETRGAIAVFMSVIILLLVILEGFLIDGSKVLAAKMTMSSAGEMALNAGLTEYNEALRDIYGLFAVSKSTEDLQTNLKKYYKQTIMDSTGIEDEGYIDQMYAVFQRKLKNSITGAGTGENQLGSLIDLDLSDSGFSVQGVKGTELSNSHVLKSQLLQYMKYRGPASLGYGMFEKLTAFKDIKKQQKAMDSKLNYEEKMSDIQEECINAYRTIKLYNDKLVADLNANNIKEKSENVNKNQIYSIVATKAWDQVRRDIVPEAKQEWEQEENIGDYVTSYDSYDSEYCNLKNANGQINGMGNDHEAVGAGLSSGAIMPNEIVSATNASVHEALLYDREFENIKKLSLAYANFVKAADNKIASINKEIAELEDGENEDGIEELEELKEDIHDRMEELAADYEGDENNYGTKNIIEDAKNDYVNMRKSLQTYVGDRYGEATDTAYAMKTKADDVAKLAQSGMDALDAILNKMSELKTLGSAWESSINALPDGDSKAAMSADYKSESEVFTDTEKIKALRKILEDGKAYAEEVRDAYGKAKCLTKNTADFGEGKSRAVLAVGLINAFENSNYASETVALINGAGISANNYHRFDHDKKILEHASISDTSLNTYVVKDNTVNETLTVTSVIGLVIPPYDTTEGFKKIQPVEDEFYKYLERTCPLEDDPNETEADKTERNDAKAKKENLLKQAQTNVQADGSFNSLPNLDGDSSGKVKETSNSASDKDVSSNYKDNTNSSMRMFDDLEALLENGRDKLYITEYAAKMFTCYTSNIDDATGSSSLKFSRNEAKEAEESLSGYTFSKTHNFAYQAENEYVLWGGEDSNQNIKSTLSTIFGIRLLLNSIYAFTGDAEIRSTTLALATAIAGWTGFGVPLVQSVLIIGFSLAETSYDMQMLKCGRSIPIYKSTTTWICKPSGIGNEVIGDTIAVTAQAVKDEAFKAAKNLTKEGISTFNTKVNAMSKSLIDDVVDKGTNAVLQPVQARLTGLIAALPDSNTVDEAIDSVLAEEKSKVENEPESITKTIKLKALDEYGSVVKEKVQSLVSEVKTQTGIDKKTIQDKVESTFTGLQNNIKGGLKSKATELINKVSSEAQIKADKVTDNLEKQATEKLNDMLVKVDCGISLDGGKIHGAGTIDKNGITRSGSTNFTMNYKEYVWMFIALKSMSSEGEERILNRISKLIEVNVGGTGKFEGTGVPLKMSEAYTMLQVTATADLHTNFFALPVPDNHGGARKLGTDRYAISYTGVLGY